MSSPSFNVNFSTPSTYPYSPATPVYTPAPGDGSLGFGGDAFTGTSPSSMPVALGVGAMAGFKAPRGLESVRSRLGVTKYGTRSRVGTRYRGNQGGGYRYNSYGYGRGRVNYDEPSPFGIRAAIKSSVVVGAVISLATNLWDLHEHRLSGAQAGANVAGDVVSAAVGGAGGAIVSSIGTGILAAMGMSGGLLGLAGLGLGFAGYMMADSWLRNTNAFRSLQSGVYRMFGGV